MKSSYWKSPPPRMKRQRGFTLVEIMIVVVIIGLLASMAMAAFNKMREISQNTATTNDLRIFAGAFSHYILENGSYPAESGPGVVPTGMGTYMPGGAVGKFTQATPIGGNYDWDFNAYPGVMAGVSVTAPVVPVSQLSKLVAKTDNIQLISGNVVYVIE